MTLLQSTSSTPETVAANSRGELTPTQRAYWQKQRNNALTGGLVSLAVVGVLGIMASLFIGNMSFYSAELVNWIAPILLGAVGMFMVVSSGQQLVGALLLHQDLSAGQVAQTEGAVVWQGNDYRVEFPGRPFWAERSVHLPPGQYRLFYLPRSWRVIAGERLGGETSEAQALTNVLAQTLGYAAEALNENRAGRLHPQQAAKLQREAIFQIVIAAVVGLPLLGAAVFFILDDLENTFPAPVMLGLFGVVVIGALGWQALNRLRDIGQGTVATTTGLVTKYLRRSRNATSYYYRIHNLSFGVDAAAYNALLPGEYRVYYLERSKQMVGIEPI